VEPRYVCGIAEFSRNPAEEAVVQLGGDDKTAFTQRGAIRIIPKVAIRPVASESISKLGWSQRVALCLAEVACTLNQRTALTELGPDIDAIREQDRDAIRFDLGLGALQSDLCVRVADLTVVTELRKYVGRTVLDPENPAIGIVLAANPHRVFVSRVGRVEVYQPIPPASGKSPDGPHTHVLPKLLRHQRTHAATETIPAGWVPCAHFYPIHPMKDTFGRPRPFDQAHHSEFQSILARYGDVENNRLKARVTALVIEGCDPRDQVLAADRVSRTSVRLALRQLRAANANWPALKAWLAAYDYIKDKGVEDQREMEGG
jgi:hypothetical protein